MRRNIYRHLLPIFLFTSFAAPLSAASPGGLGMWVWHREEVVEPARRAELLAFSQRHGIDLLLVQIRYTGRGEARAMTDTAAMSALLREARAAGIRVEALDGSAEMAFEANRPETLQALRSLLAFHKAQPPGAGFAGIHYDIEPYLTPRWKNGDEPGVIRETLDTMAAIYPLVKAADPALTVAYDIPSWYDSHERLVVAYNGAKKNFHQHIQDLSDYIGVMSYRRKAVGPNSVTYLCTAELAYGRKIGKPVYPSLETVELKDEPQITFYGQPAADFLRTLDEVRSTLRSDSAFGGVLLHQYRTLRLLLEGGKGKPSAIPAAQDKAPAR
ncbi:hypothetical protein OPIT5_23955 [Opitutaceae bacterium TAV5]|nr:hypothetical protein OPIT5_23955 [Opitutaceae bacterium TAV5]